MRFVVTAAFVAWAAGILPTLASSQSLAEVANKEKERRKTVTGESKTTDDRALQEASREGLSHHGQRGRGREGRVRSELEPSGTLFQLVLPGLERTRPIPPHFANAAVLTRKSFRVRSSLSRARRIKQGPASRLQGVRAGSGRSTAPCRRRGSRMPSVLSGRRGPAGLELPVVGIPILSGPPLPPPSSSRPRVPAEGRTSGEPQACGPPLVRPSPSFRPRGGPRD